ncbi:MAG: hypothetical protein HKN87_16955 [Saprospiraceae bacterium]|nr:hypothetical protein [Saprospiraceae bacterium]
MMEETNTNERDKRRGWIISFATHAVILILALLPFLQYEDPPPGQQGVLVSFGAPDMGSGDDRPDTQQEAEVVPEPPSEEEMVEEEVVEDPVEEVVEEEVAPVEEFPEPTPDIPEEVVTKDEPDVAAIQKKKEEEERKKIAEAEKAKKAEEARKKALAEVEAKKKAEAEAQKKADYEKAKKQFGDSFGGGKGETDAPGNQGDPNGDPDASRLEGISTGSGVVGGGLGDRGVVYEPKIKDNSQKTGTVVVRVCVGRDGQVVSADYTQRGSTTADSELRAIAIRSAKRFKFSKSSIDKQCGTITIDFKVR